MVGMNNMISSMSSCAFCKGNKDSVTICDKTNKPLCRKCATIVPVPASVSDTLIQVVAKQHAPKRHIAKLQQAAINRGEKYEI